jgi:hypothetical protein
MRLPLAAAITNRVVVKLPFIPLLVVMVLHIEAVFVRTMFINTLQLLLALVGELFTLITAYLAQAEVLLQAALADKDVTTPTVTITTVLILLEILGVARLVQQPLRLTQGAQPTR